VESQHQLVGMLQLTFIPYLTHIGTWRCLIEGVRIHSAHRGKGYGELMFQQAIELAREKGCKLVQLTSDKQRPDAIRFYEKLGFIASHEGFKLTL
jgi:GNAT superfamily N-acetyltransferase